jgi:hypothetical protein
VRVSATGVGQRRQRFGIATETAALIEQQQWREPLGERWRAGPTIAMSHPAQLAS